MNAENISYCCRREEFEALRLMLRQGVPPGLGPLEMDEGAFRTACDSLEDAGVLSKDGDGYVVDRLFAFFVTEIAGAQSAFSLRGGGRHAIVYAAEHCAMLLELAGGSCTMTSFQTLSSARDMLAALSGRMTPPVAVEAFSPGGETETASLPDPRQDLDSLYALFDSFRAQAGSTHERSL